MEWKTEKPIEKYGFYWFRGRILDHGKAAVHLPLATLVRYAEETDEIAVPCSCGRVAYLTNLGVMELERHKSADIEDWDGEWAGPIEPPR
jgi:hypothetical protein